MPCARRAQVHRDRAMTYLPSITQQPLSSPQEMILKSTGFSFSQVTWSDSVLHQCFFKKILWIYFFRQRGREGEKHQCMVASHEPLLGTWPTTKACALIGNLTGDPLVLRLVLSPLSHTSQGYTNSSTGSSQAVTLGSIIIPVPQRRKWLRASIHSR